MLVRLSILISLLVSSFLGARAGFATCKNRAGLVPPQVDDYRRAVALMNQVREELADQSWPSCLTFLPYEETSAGFDIVGVTSGFSRRPSEFGRRQVRWLRENYQLTHLVFLVQDKTADRFVARVFAMNDDGGLVLVRRTRVDPVESRENRLGRVSRLLTRMAPNSVTLGYSSTRAYFELDESRYVDESITTRGTVPPLLSSISITRVEHRRAFGILDVGGSVFPSQYLYGIDQRNRYKQKPDLPDRADHPDELEMRIEAYGGCLTVSAEGALYSPLGTSFVGIGWGPCVHWLDTDYTTPRWFLKVASRLFFGHRVFITDDVFSEFTWDSMLFNEHNYDYSQARSRQIERWTVSLGWYVRDTERLAGSLWGNILN